MRVQHSADLRVTGKEVACHKAAGPLGIVGGPNRPEKTWVQVLPVDLTQRQVQRGGNRCIRVKAMWAAKAGGGQGQGGVH